MKTLAVSNSLVNKQNNIAFRGHSVYTADTGFRRHKFFLPFDDKKFNAEIEFVNLIEENGEWIIDPDIDETITLKIGKNGISLKDKELLPFADSTIGYRYVLTPKNNPNKKIYKIDSGVVTNPQSPNAEDNFTVLHANRPVMPHNGLTKQVMPDLLPGYKLEFDKFGKYEVKYDDDARKRALGAVRTHANKLGGNFAGIIQMLPTWEREGYTKLVGTPFTKDEVSSHLYWTENPYQVANSLGTLNEFKALQIELFKHGQNFIADGAFVNQGLQGIFFKNVLKHGENSPFFHWFKATGILGSDLKLGAIPGKPKARENFRFRLVNAPVKIIEKDGKIKLEKNIMYDDTKTTYLQLYDKRLVTKKELTKDSELLTKYSVTNTENPYEITGHDDVTQLLTFEVNPKDYTAKLKKAIKTTPETQRKFSNEELIESLLTFPNYRITTKDKGGFDLWDGNMDIAKLSFYIGNTDNLLLERFENEEDRLKEIEKLKKAVLQVQNFTLGAGRYWTKLVADTQLEYIATVLKDAKPTVEGYKTAIKKAVENGELPKKVTEVINDDVIRNVINGKYKLERTHKDKGIDDHWVMGYLKERIAAFPLASIEFAPDLNAVLASPYLTKRTSNETTSKLTRLEIKYLVDDNKMKPDPDYVGPYEEMDELIFNDMTRLARDIIFKINNEISYVAPDKLLFNKSNRDITEFGKYVMPLILPEIMRFIMFKGFNPDARVEMNPKTGQVFFDEKAFRQISLQSIGADGTPKEEATQVVRKLKKGIKQTMLSNDQNPLASTLTTRILKLSTNSLRLAEAIMDKTESGLGWRIDAAKDIGNIDAIRYGFDSDEQLMHKVTEFWGKFNDEVKAQNKHAYTTAEITDLDKVISSPNGIFKNDVNAETKFIEQSGLNNTANYMFFYSMLKNLFSKDAEKGILDNFNNIRELYNKLIVGWSGKCHGFLYQYPGDSIANSYTFVGNHDKPRVLHIFALDMELFHSDFTNSNHRDIAKKVLNLSAEEHLDVYSLSSNAIAMGDRILNALEATGLLVGSNATALKKAVSELASGTYKGEKFDANAFGARDFRFAIKDVFDVAEQYGFHVSNRQEATDKVLQNILEPAMDKMESVYKMLVTLPGSPTDFVGDKEGSSGYETKANNDYQQNRNVVPFEWVNKHLSNPYLKQFDAEKDFVNNYYLRMTKIGNLRAKKELSALTNGTTIALPIQSGKTEHNNDCDVAATFRYDDKGSQVICLYTTAGATTDNTSKMNRPRVDLEKIVLGYEGNNWKEGLKGGLRVGDTFKNANNNDIYKVVLEDGQYLLKREHSIYKNISIMPEDKNTAVLYKVDPEAYNSIPAHLYNDAIFK